MKTKIAGGLERAFATRGFTEPSVEYLRDAAKVSLRTLYKYAPSREAMVRMALQHRHQRYMAHVFATAETTGRQTLPQTFDRIADWMRTEASHGCLFHAAVASAPDDPDLRSLLETHKAEVAETALSRSGTHLDRSDLMVIIEGLTQAWPLSKEATLISAKRLVEAAETAAAASPEP